MTLREKPCVGFPIPMTADNVSVVVAAGLGDFSGMETPAATPKPLVTMLVAACCGASTFAFDFTRLVAKTARQPLYSPAKELSKVSLMKLALAPQQYTTLDAGLRRLAGVARLQNETLFFVAEAKINLLFEHAGEKPEEPWKAEYLINSGFVAEALRLRSAVVIAHRNPLDLLLCSTDDCFQVDWAVMEPTFLNGSFSPLCFTRRTALERLYVRVHDFNELKTKLRELASMPETITQFFSERGFGVDRPIPAVRVEDLAAFQYEETPGALQALSIRNWGILLNEFGIGFSTELLQSLMDQVVQKWGVRHDELYSDRFWVPAREEDGLMQMRANVEAIVDEFGFKRTPSSKLIDWTVKQTQFLSEQAANMPRHGLNG
jgi:hypothetical protein